MKMRAKIINLKNRYQRQILEISKNIMESPFRSIEASIKSQTIQQLIQRSMNGSKKEELLFIAFRFRNLGQTGENVTMIKICSYQMMHVQEQKVKEGCILFVEAKITRSENTLSHLKLLLPHKLWFLLDTSQIFISLRLMESSLDTTRELLKIIKQHGTTLPVFLLRNRLVMFLGLWISLGT